MAGSMPGRDCVSNTCSCGVDWQATGDMCGLAGLQSGTVVKAQRCSVGRITTQCLAVTHGDCAIIGSGITMTTKSHDFNLDKTH